MSCVCRNGASQFKPVTHVIFDMDGTLISTEAICTQAYRTVIEFLGAKLTDEIVLKIMGCTEKDACAIMVKDLHLPIPPEELLNRYHEEAYKNLDKCDLLPGVKRLITHLKNNNIPIAVATSSSQEGFDVKTRNHKDFFKMFHHAVCFGSDPVVKRGKPNPDLFQRAAALFPDNPKPNQCLVFEDAPNGVTAALAAGMQCVIVPAETTSPDLYKHATLKINRIDEVDLSLFKLPRLPLNACKEKQLVPILSCRQL